jgi:hypothetical protein
MSVDLSVLIVEEVSDPELEDEDPRFSHLVGPIYTDEGKISGSARVTEAMIMGTPVEALCGYTWVPSRNPDRYPLCPRCKEINERTGDA